MVITTQDIIKMLSFDPEFKSQLLAQWDQLNPDQKYTVEGMLWDAYETVYELKLKANLDVAMLDVADKQEDLDTDFYKRIQEKTKLEMQKESNEKVSSTDLSETRKELEKILTQSHE